MDIRTRNDVTRKSYGEQLFEAAHETKISKVSYMFPRPASRAASVSFYGSFGGTLRLDDTVHFGGLVAGFGIPDQLDLADIAYVASGSSATTSSGVQLTSGANASGTLTVAEGGHTANITLLGQYVAANFHIQSDGAGAPSSPTRRRRWQPI